MSISKKRIYLSSPHMGGSELKYVHEAFDTNWIAPLGPNVDAFEEALCKYTGVKHAAALSSGTAAIHLALILLGVERGDEVIASSFTFSATVNPIVYLGATPVLVDSEPGTWNMDPQLLEEAIKSRIAHHSLLNSHSSPLTSHRSSLTSQRSPLTSHLSPLTSQRSPLTSHLSPLTSQRSPLTSHLSPLTSHRLPKAIIVVHLYGMPANMDKIMEIANRYEIPVIEDAAEALGSTYKGRQVGSFGKIGILSFNGNKIITTSGGGALISDNIELVQKARFLATQARDKAPHYQHSQIGYNYRMSNVLAGIGLGQMEVIDQRVKQRRDNFNFYKTNLGNIEGITFLEEPDESYFSNHWLTTILIDPEKTGKTREDLQIALEKENIETRPLWKPMHLQPVFSFCPAYISGTSEDLFKKGLCLPSGSNMTDDDRGKVLDLLNRNLKDYLK